MSLTSVKDFFKRIGVDIAKAVAYVPALEAKYAKAVKAATNDSAETISTGRPFVAAVAVASASIAAAYEAKGLSWTADESAVASVEAAFKLWPAFWAAIEKEGSDIKADL